MKIVKNKLTPKEWELLNYLKENCVGLENALNGIVLAVELGMTSKYVRHLLSGIRKKQEIIIGSHTKKGYYIPLNVELKDSLKYSENKTLSHLKSAIQQRPEFALKVYKTLNELVKKAPKEIQGQIKMQFNGWETETVNYTGDKYVKEKI